MKTYVLYTQDYDDVSIEAVFTDRGKAEKLAEEFKKLGESPYIIEKELDHPLVDGWKAKTVYITYFNVNDQKITYRQTKTQFSAAPNTLYDTHHGESGQTQSEVSAKDADRIALEQIKTIRENYRPVECSAAWLTGTWIIWYKKGVEAKMKEHEFGLTFKEIEN